MSRSRLEPQSAKPPPRRAILLASAGPDRSASDVEVSLAELAALLSGLNIEVLDTVVQKRSAPATTTYLGPGKIRAVAERTGGPGTITRLPTKKGADSADEEELVVAASERLESGPAVDVVVVDDELSPAQQRNLERAFEVQVMDRTAVILRVFAERARTRMARLEVELAQFAYELPRIRDDAQIGDREGGGGRGGRGNSNVELAKQASREHIAALRREIAELRVVSQTQRARRATARTVALVGYTNAGKSSWLRALTGSDVLVENKLFATLGTTVRQLAPAPPPAILIADTVGFIRRLPHALVESFRSTLDEVNDASILLIVVDASDPTFRDQLAVTREVMEALGAADRPWRILLNKVDRLDEEARAALRDEYPDAWMFSAHQPADVAEVRSRIVGWFQEAMTLERIEVPYGLQHVLQEMRTAAQIVSEEYLENIVIHVRASPDLLMRWKKQLAS